jgi:restriction system protein
MIPSFQELMKPFLEYLKDEKVHTIGEAEEYLAKHFDVADEERHQLLPSGKQAIFRNRVGWARTYLYKAGLLNVPQRASIVITQRGLEVLKENPEKIDIKYLMKFPEFVEFHKSHNAEEKIERKESPEGDISPDEIIAQKIEEINNILKSELLEKILKSSPQFFERLVLDLVVKMGYGGSFEDVSQLLGKGGDEGVDGLIKEDVLGLDNVYLQAKRWGKGIVGRPEIQGFVGALHGKGAKKGIFITTSTFSKEAIEYAEDLKDMNVVLIDKDKLLNYMLKYHIGVEVKDTIEIKKIDEDYFEEF